MSIAEPVTGLHGRVIEELIIKSVVLSRRDCRPWALSESVALRKRQSITGPVCGQIIWTQTVKELREDLVSSGKLNDALVDSFLGHCADPAWWTQTIAFTAVHGYAACE